jgi:hypothetical protein
MMEVLKKENDEVSHEIEIYGVWIVGRTIPTSKFKSEMG